MAEGKPARKSWLKRILKWICVLLLIVLIIAVAALLFIDHVAKIAVENAGPLVAKVPFHVERLWIQPLGGSAEITNLQMGIPDGYKSKYSILLGDVRAKINLKSLTTDKIVIHKVVLKDITINYETPITFTSSNIQDIVNNVNEMLGAVKEAEEQAEEQAKEQGAEEPEELKLQLDRLVIKNVRLNVVSKETGVSVPLIITLPELGPFGEGEEGITPADLTMTISNSLFSALLSCIDESKNMLIKSLTDLGSKTLDAAGEAVGAAANVTGAVVNATGSTLKGVGSSATDATKKVVDSVGNLLQTSGDSAEDSSK